MSKNTPNLFANEIESKKNIYLTTSIPYVNAAPHVGFALEMIQADCLARLYRLQGQNVRFQTGADENSLKNVNAAIAAGTPVKQFVRKHSDCFYQLKEALSLSFDDFIRTSSDQRHLFGVAKLWQACADNGDIYKRKYSGLYCVGCEQFYKSTELKKGCCPEHGTKLEEIAEENYFFRLSRYEERLRKALLSRKLDIVPESRRNEALAWIKNGLEDFSISRTAKRAKGWGIPVPGDPEQVMYVWFDALGNYITALGYGVDNAVLSRYWHKAACREHIIGKGITRFHTIYWPAILLSAGLPLPTRIFVHGYVTAEGKKIGKSTGNAIDPVPLADQLGADALRYYLLRHIRSTQDGDFAQDRFFQAYDSELVGQLGNLANRTFSMIHRYCDGIIPANNTRDDGSSELYGAVSALKKTVAGHIRDFRFQDALIDIWKIVALANKYVSVSEPWSLAKIMAKASNADISADAKNGLDICLLALADALCIIAQCLAPMLPATSRKLLTQLGFADDAHYWNEKFVVAGTKLHPGGILFPKRKDCDL